MTAGWIVVAVLLACSVAGAQPREGAAPPGSDDAPARPTDVARLEDWLAYRAASQIPDFPDEARVFYRRGLMAHEAGSREDAVRLERGAALLDPGFVEPHLTLASWFALVEPAQAVSELGDVLEIVYQSFPDQLHLAANTAHLVVQALYLALLAAVVLVLIVRQGDLRHRVEELLVAWIPRGPARVLAWPVLVAPFTLGLGPVPPALALSGILWPVLRKSERALWVIAVLALAAAPAVVRQMDRLGSPLRSEHAPFYGILAPPELGVERLQGLAGLHAHNPFVQYGYAWAARRAGMLDASEEAYGRVLAAWPEDARTLNNLANLFEARGRMDEALAHYRRAVAAEPANAAALYNLARLHARRFEMDEANRLWGRAAALRYDLLQSLRAQANSTLPSPTVDLWIAPRRYWDALADYRLPAGASLAVPAEWRARPEASWPFALGTALLAILAAVAGTLAQRALPQRPCGNCRGVVCRRCGSRRREVALCNGCSLEVAGAESPEFSRLLLERRRGRVEVLSRIPRTALAALVPGYGSLAFQHVVAAVTFLAATAALATLLFGHAFPYAFEPRLAMPDRIVPTGLLIGPWVALYLLSLLGYVHDSARARTARVQAERAARRGPPRRVVERAA